MELAAVHGGLLEHCVQQFLAGRRESLRESVRRHIKSNGVQFLPLRAALAGSEDRGLAQPAGQCAVSAGCAPTVHGAAACPPYGAFTKGNRR
jgi:hypothetical protein